jgi:hypothetical protein
VTKAGRPRAVIARPWGANFGGWSLYAHEGPPQYHYNFLGLQQFDVTSTREAALRNRTSAYGIRL